MGNPDAVKVTVPLNPLSVFAVTLTVPPAFSASVNVAGETETVKPALPMVYNPLAIPLLL